MDGLKISWTVDGSQFSGLYLAEDFWIDGSRYGYNLLVFKMFGVILKTNLAK